MDITQNNLVVLLIILAQTLMTLGERQTTSRCFSDPNKVLKVKCPDHHMLLIFETKYGRNNDTDVCHFMPGDCVERERKHYDVGRQELSINLPSGSIGRVIPNCGYSTYFQIDYECVPTEDTVNVCDNKVMTSQQGYITTPNYPFNYGNNLHCTTTIRVQPGQKIKLYILDINIEEPPKDSSCNDYLYMNDKVFGSSTVCRTMQDHIELFHTYHYNSLEVTFVSDAQVNRKGFWLYYEADPEMSTTTNKLITKQPTNPTMTPSSTTNTLQSTTSTQRRNPKIMITTLKPQRPTYETLSESIPTQLVPTEPMPTEKKQDLPFGAIIGGVLGSLLFVLVVLLSLLIYRRLREKKLREQRHYDMHVSSSIAQIQNSLNDDCSGGECNSFSEGYYC
ncbi:unnamed protein product [Owenia fusiformis]|uniref:Uncharacterized protein n=1 Tax=Owenia fusiformis TaxID=6347 RepID=A0A8J1TD19_OWEFU|nr:unnamed protein product [Owenia fusiformis]